MLDNQENCAAGAAGTPAAGNGSVRRYGSITGSGNRCVAAYGAVTGCRAGAGGCYGSITGSGHAVGGCYEGSAGTAPAAEAAPLPRTGQAAEPGASKSDRGSGGSGKGSQGVLMWGGRGKAGLIFLLGEVIKLVY